jgi:hypothetical protein
MKRLLVLAAALWIARWAALELAALAAQRRWFSNL